MGGHKVAKDRVRRGLGELLVIVAGVLIALVVENQWSQYGDRVDAREYLVRLAAELDDNREWLEVDVDWATQACTSAQATLEYARSPSPDAVPDEVLRYAVSAAMHASGGAARTTYDDLVNTGHLSLIEDVDLRRVISEAYGAFEGRETWRPTVDDPFRLAVLRTLPFDFVQEVLEECVRVDGTQVAGSVLATCAVVPEEGGSEQWLSVLMERPDLIGDLRERVYGVCRFDDQSEGAGIIADSLSAVIDTALR